MSEADDIKAAAAASADASSAALSADEKRLKAREAFFDILEREKETHKDIHKKAKEELADMEIAKSMGIERLELAEKRRDVLDKFNAQEQEANKAAYKAAKENSDLTKEELETAKEVYYQKQKTLLLAQKANEAQREGAKSAQSMAARYLGLTKDGGKMFDSLGDKTVGFVEEMGEMLTVSNIAAAGLTKIAEASFALAVEQDAAAVAFNKSTGQAGTYNAQIRGLERGMVNAGVSSAEAGQAFTDLFTTVTDFSNMSERTQNDLAKNVALLNELGVSSAESAQSIQFLTKVMGKSAEQATAQTREIFVFAQELGVSAAGMSADFIKMQPQIAALGDTGVQAFKDLQAQAKATGMSFDSLLSITAKFDTFASAADQVGKLNAVMGGPFLNTLEMVAATDPAERMRKLSEGINASGLSFDDMSYYQKKAMTSAAGLNSEMELAMLMSGKLENARGPVKSQADFEDLAAQTAEFNTVFEEMKQFGMSLAVSFGPLVSMLKTGIDFLSEYPEAVKMVTGALVGMALAVSILTTGLTLMAIAKALGDGGKTMLIGPEMVSLPKGSQVAANGSAAFNRQVAQPPATGGSTTPSAPPVVNVTVKIGDQELKQLVQSVEVKPYVDGKKSKLYDSMMTGISQEIMKTA
mgnify:CR=1 FL=1